MTPVHAARQCIDKGSFLKMTRFHSISSLRPKAGVPLSDEAIKCVQKTKQIVLV